MTPPEIAADVLEVLATISGIPQDKINNQDDLVGDVGLDSLEQTEVMMELEDKFGMDELDDDATGDIITVQDLIDYCVQNQLNKL